jgi:ribosomal protein S17
MEIEKKVWPEYFEKIASGEKTFELRLADWECNEGDTLRLREWNPDSKEYTGREITKTVGYVLKTKDVTFFPADEVEKHGYQIISLK